MTAPHPAPDHTVVDWLSRLYDECEDGWLSLFSLNRTTGDRHVDWAPVTDYDALAAAAAVREPDCCVWLGVATRRRRLEGNQRGTAADCLELPGLWLDIDIAGPGHATEAALPPDRDAAWALIEDFPIPPSAVVDSGGGLQPWWLFTEPLPADKDAERLLARWGAWWAAKADARGWHLDNVFDVARVMRLPGTTNRKAEPRPVELVHTADVRVGPDDLDQFLIDPPTPAQAPAGERIPYIGPTRPGDAFNARHHAAEVLAAHGWTHARTDRNGDQHWCRPGKEPRQGTSATIYAEDGHTTIWSSTAVAMWPTLEVRRPYDPFGLHTHLAHGGDWRAASDELERHGYGTKARPDTITLNPQPPVEDESPDDPPVLVGSSWRRTDLAEIVEGLTTGTLERPLPTIGRFHGGDGGLFYPGRVNGLYGEPGKGKTWIALCCAAEQLNAGETVAWIDLEEPAPGIVGRLLDLQVDPDAIIDRFAHYAPEEPIARALGLAEDLAQLTPALVVIDSTGEALALEGAGPNNDDEVASWFRTWPRWIADHTGAAVVVIDHVVKDEGARGLWPGGSQRKKAAINGAAFMATPIHELGRGVQGRLKLVTSKDRNGHHRNGHKAGEFVLDARGDRSTWWIEPHTTPTDSRPFRPTVLMERVSRWLEEHQEPASKRAIGEAVKGNHDARATAIDRLVEEGFVRRWVEGQIHLHEHVRPFRELTDNPPTEGAENT